MAYRLMANCRSIPPAIWEHAREALITFFASRHGRVEAEELTHETLTAILLREDYSFDSPDDFLKVCYGFARNVLKAHWRAVQKANGNDALDDSMTPPESRPGPMKSADAAIFLEQVLRTGREQLAREDWQLLWDSAMAQMDGERYNFDPKSANRLRVRLHRARKKLSGLTGWDFL